jgi:hypothetical protein
VRKFRTFTERKALIGRHGELVTALVTVTLDVDRVMRVLGAKAMHAKTKRATVLQKGVRVSITEVA